ncbi:MAG: polysaccharide deacetylase family protein [Pseudomonadales bacterium]|nr:polysaccharide deacetylase family protein [Pseudomonadales bacterium]
MARTISRFAHLLTVHLSSVHLLSVHLLSVRLLTVLLLIAASTDSHGAEHGVVLLYHHVSSTTPSSTSVRPAQFEAHLDYLSAKNFNVMQLSKMVAALAAREPIPAKSVAITFDDAYQSVYDTAMPLLKSRKMPFTIFVNTSKAAEANNAYLDWQELREIQDVGGEIQNHGHSHGHLAYPQNGETQDAWRQRVTVDVTAASALIVDKLDVRPTLFAYPYGEYSKELKEIVSDLELFATGQHSGAVGFDSDFLGLPRHPFYTGADSLKRLAERTHTRPLYIEAHPMGPLRVREDSFVSLDLQNAEMPLNCFFDGALVEVESAANTVRILSLGPFPKRRTKLNCTKPDGLGGYLWWSYLFLRE